MAQTKRPVRQKIVLELKADVSTRDKKRKSHKRPNQKLPPALQVNVWKPGQSGNPKGRPKGTGEILISKAYRARSQEAVPDELFNIPEFAHLKKICKGITWAELVALGQLRSAAGGNTMAAKEIREAVEGKIPDKQAFTDAEGNNLPPAPVALNVSFVTPKKHKD